MPKSRMNPHLLNRGKRRKRTGPTVTQSSVNGTPLFQVNPCMLCPQEPKRPARHSHHIRPLEFGGADNGARANLCASCHDELHRLVRAVENGKIATDDIGNTRLRYYVSEFLSQKALFDAGETSAPDARRRISVSLTEEELELAHFTKDYFGHSSLVSLVKSLLNEAGYKAQSGK